MSPSSPRRTTQEGNPMSNAEGSVLNECWFEAMVLLVASQATYGVYRYPLLVLIRPPWWQVSQPRPLRIGVQEILASVFATLKR